MDSKELNENLKILRSNKMKRNLLLLAVMVVAVLSLNSHSFAQCSEDPIDLGICDTLYVQTFDCDHVYDVGPYDSVRVAIFVTHDSNTFWWDGGGRYVQDSISGFVVPLKWSALGCADSITLPTTLNWNNKKTDRSATWKRSIFRDITDTHTGEVDSNIFTIMTDLGWDPWTHSVNFKGDSCMLSSIAPGIGKWWEGSKLLYATVTFLVYGLAPDPGCDSAYICLDSTFWPPGSNLAITRYDAVNYVPRHFLPVCDTIYVPPNQPPQFSLCPGADSRNCDGNYATGSFTVNDVDGTISQIVATFAGNGVDGVVACSLFGLTTATASGKACYHVADHCLAGGTITVTATDDKGGTAQCLIAVNLTNDLPSITCPGDKTGPYNVLMVSGDFSASDACGEIPTVAINPPVAGFSIVGSHVEWQPTCNDVDIDYAITLVATDRCGATASCTFHMEAFNTAPTITCNPPLNKTASVGIGKTFVGAITVTDPENASVLSYTSTLGATVVPHLNGDVDYLSANAGTDTVCITVTDGCQGLTAFCCFYVVVSSGPSNVVWIPNSACVQPGDLVELPILLKALDEDVQIGAFELEVEFDYIDLTLLSVTRGHYLLHEFDQDAPYPWMTAHYTWEYFNYRLLPCPLCACCKYKILIYGQNDTPNGQTKLGYCLNETYLTPPVGNVTAGDTVLAWLKFQVANNDLLRGLKLPVCFEWEDAYCGENTFSNCTGETLFVSMDPEEFPEDCIIQQPPELPGYIVRAFNFYCGGVDVCPPEALKCERGDINLNHIAYEPADAVLFARYFVMGLDAFRDDPVARASQICATDVNADGRTLMLSDLIYMIRVIQHDATAYPKLGPSSEVANLIVSGDKIMVECASPIGGLLFEFAGNVNPTLLNTNMEILSNQNKVLVWSSAGHSINGASDLLGVSGNLVSVIAVDREGRELNTTITSKVAPTSFALNPAYPNPFNPSTNLSFTLPVATAYRMSIYNVAGQLVRSYDGMGNVGLNVITWDGKDNSGSEVSSGVYFYKLIAGTFTATNKMVMMK